MSNIRTVTSKHSVQDLRERFEEVASRHQFGVLGVHDLRGKLNSKGIPFDHDCLVFEVCQPQQAAKVLAENLSISTALPCRISVFSEGGVTKLATIRPTALLEMFDVPGLRTVAEEIEREIFAMMDELES